MLARPRTRLLPSVRRWRGRSGPRHGPLPRTRSWADGGDGQAILEREASTVAAERDVTHDHVSPLAVTLQRSTLTLAINAPRAVRKFEQRAPDYQRAWRRSPLRVGPLLLSPLARACESVLSAPVRLGRAASPWSPRPRNAQLG